MYRADHTGQIYFIANSDRVPLDGSSAAATFIFLSSGVWLSLCRDPALSAISVQSKEWIFISRIIIILSVKIALVYVWKKGKNILAVWNRRQANSRFDWNRSKFMAIFWFSGRDQTARDSKTIGRGFGFQHWRQRLTSKSNLLNVNKLSTRRKSELYFIMENRRISVFFFVKVDVFVYLIIYLIFIFFENISQVRSKGVVVWVRLRNWGHYSLYIVTHITVGGLVCFSMESEAAAAAPPADSDPSDGKTGRKDRQTDSSPVLLNRGWLWFFLRSRVTWEIFCLNLRWFNYFYLSLI